MQNAFLHLVWKFRTTLSLALLLLVFGLWSGSLWNPLPKAWVRGWGYCPQDLLNLDIVRFFACALVTAGGGVFFRALAMTCLSVGLTEHLTGSRRAFFVFWGTHLATLLVESLLIALPLNWAGIQAGEPLVLVRDVGPSAGYFGSLGYALAKTDKRWGIAIGIVVYSGILLSLILQLLVPQPAPALSATLAHVIAFPLGWITSRFLP